MGSLVFPRWEAVLTLAAMNQDLPAPFRRGRLGGTISAPRLTNPEAHWVIRSADFPWCGLQTLLNLCLWPSARALVFR